MKNLIDDLIYCCPPQAFHLVLSLACTGSFKPLCNTWLHNSEHATWRGHHLSTFHLSEHGAEGTADAQEPRLQAPPGDQRRSCLQLQQEEAEYESHLLSLQAAAEGWASHSLASPTKNKLYFALSDLFVLLFRRELPRVPVCFWSHQGAQCPPATRFHESHLPWHQPLTLSPNLGAGMSNLTLLRCRAEVSPFTDVGYATCSRGTIPHGESWKACPSISIFNKALKNWKTAEDWKNASSPPIFSKVPLNKS